MFTEALATNNKPFQLNEYHTQTKQKQIITTKKKPDKMKLSPWRWLINIIENTWEENLGQVFYQLESDTKKLQSKRKTS